MTQKYPDEQSVLAPGTVIISAAAEVMDIRKTVEPVLQPVKESFILYINLSKDGFKLGGSSFAQVLNKLGTETPSVIDIAYFGKAFNVIQDLVKRNLILAGHDISSGGMITALLEMTFAQPGIGMDINLDYFPEKDTIKILFSENPGLLIQVEDLLQVEEYLKENKLEYYVLGLPNFDKTIGITHDQQRYDLPIEKLRDTWYRTSYLLDRKQCGDEKALARYTNYKKQPLQFTFPADFTGKAQQYNIDLKRKNKTGIRTAIIREKGVNGDREMAYSMYLAGMDVKDVHMTDLIAGRETLEDINMIVFVGGFSNSDVLGSAKGWAGAFLYNPKAKQALDNFYKRDDTLSLGVCNGCQLMIELGLITKKHKKIPEMLFNESHKFESAFINVDIPENNSIMLHSLAGSRLGIWVAHGEGKFSLPLDENQYHIPLKYSYAEYPGNPNGSDYNTAALCSEDGRHLAMMPHLERSVFPWNWAHYPTNRKSDEITPWVEAFVNARNWIQTQK